MHVLTLLHRIMGKYQISCGDIEMAKRRLVQAGHIFRLGNIFSYHTTPNSDPKKI